MISIIAPCYNEEENIFSFINEIENILPTKNFIFEIIIVDDGSLDNSIDKLTLYKINKSNIELTILPLLYNVGHQEAIFQGLLYASTTDSSNFIVLDSDGEDDPQAILNLLALTENDIVFVTRGKRKENFRFRIMYFLYRIIFKFITGKKMNFGNFSMINRKIITEIIENSFIHYAAFLSKCKCKSTEICVDRRFRLGGMSKMNTSNLVLHGIKSLIEFSEELLLVFLKTTMFLICLLILSLFYVLYLKIFTKFAIVGWASNLSIGLFNAGLISFGFFIIGIMLLNLNKQNRKSRFNNLYKNPIKVK